MEEKKKTITRKKAQPKEAIISDLEIQPSEQVDLTAAQEPEPKEKQLQFNDSEGLVHRPQLKGEKKTVQPTYTQPGTNNQSRTIVKE